MDYGDMNRDEFSQKFHDMRLRVTNSTGWEYSFLGGRRFYSCPVAFWTEGKPESWRYGTLYMFQENDVLGVAFGDLTIAVSPREFMILVDIAVNPHSKYAGQW